MGLRLSQCSRASFTVIVEKGGVEVGSRKVQAINEVDAEWEAYPSLMRDDHLDLFDENIRFRVVRNDA